MTLHGPKMTKENPIGSLLEIGLKHGGQRLAVRTSTRDWTWQQLDVASRRLASAYLLHGLKQGDRVATLMPNRPALLIHYLACIKAGLVVTPLNYRYMPPEIDHALKVSGASLLLTHAERDSDVEASEMAGQLTHGVIRYGALESDLVKAADGDSFETFLGRGDASSTFSAIELEAPAFIYFTSGSTGKPKGVTHTHGTLGEMMASTIECLKLQETDNVLPAASCSHIGGSLFSLSTLAAGATVALPRTGAAQDVLPLLRSCQPTVLWMLPSSLVTLIRDRHAHAADFASIRLCFSGGDKVSAALEAEFTELTGMPIDEGYGMTEIGSALLNPVDGENRIGSVGKLAPGYLASIRDDVGNEMPVGEPGRLWIQSPANTVGYWENAKATSETIVDGWLDTGDIMVADEDQYFWFHGRKKQIIIHDGSNICPQEVEAALMEHDAIREAGVVGVHDLVHGENVRAYVTLRKELDRPNEVELIEFARERIGYKAPEQIVFLEKMPINATGKVDRVGLKSMAETHLDAATASIPEG